MTPRTAATIVAQLALCIVATMLAAAPWLRSFPAAVGAVPLLGAAGLSVLLAALSARRQLLLSLTIDLVGLVAFQLVVVLHSPKALSELTSGLVHGPSQLLTFALPLVSPRALLVDPVTLVWLAGTVAGLCVARQWFTSLPYVAFFAAFGLAYAATERAVAGDPTLREVLLGVGLLLSVLLLRAVQVWDQAQAPGRLLGAGAVATVAVSAVAVLVTQSSLFPTRATAVQRAPTISNANPLTPVALIAGLRPADPTAKGSPVFRVHTNAAVPGYLSIANVDSYDGAGWSFQRTFRPSGGVIPAEPDPALRVGRSVDQSYAIDGPALTRSPWLPYLARPAKVSGIGVDVDSTSGMIVPAGPLDNDDSYTVHSTVPKITFAQVDAATATPDTATPAIDTELPATLRTTLASIVGALASETGVSSAAPLPFLLAVQRDLERHYALVGAAAHGQQRAGGTGFADVLASILGPQRSATPEQYATLVALIARELGVPARLATGFRLGSAANGHQLAAGTHQVSTSQAWTWAEIALDGVGWVVLDPSPSTFRTPSQDGPSGAPSSATPSTLPTQNALITSANDGNAVAHPSTVHAASPGSSSGLLVAGLVVLGVIVLLLVLVLGLRKRIRRRRRRRRSDPRDRIAAAWQESIDLLYEAGLAAAGDLEPLTSHEISERVTDRFGAPTGQHAAAVGYAAETATFHSTVLVQDAAADIAWNAHHELRRALRDGSSPVDRLRTALRYHRQHRQH